MHYIMNKDTPVIAIETAQILNYTMSPYALQLVNLDYNKIYKWIMHRALPLSRANSDKIYRTLGLPRDNQEYELMCITHSLSINDNYWIANENEIGNIKYKDISIFSNSFNKSMYLVALQGDMSKFTITDKNISPEYTGQGTYPKCFVREQDGIYIYKSGSLENIKNEIYAAYVANILGVKTVNYEYKKLNNIDCSVSRIVTNETVNWETAFILSERIHSEYGLIPQEFSLQNFTEDYCNMIILDAIILNDDRHMKNWALKFNANTNQIISLAENYDFNLAFKADVKSMSNLIFEGYNKLNLLSAARKVYRTYGTNLKLEYLYNIVDSINIDINKNALKNRIKYIKGITNNQHNCY